MTFEQSEKGCENITCEACRVTQEQHEQAKRELGHNFPVRNK